MPMCVCVVPHFYSRIIIHIHILIHELRSAACFCYCCTQIRGLLFDVLRVVTVICCYCFGGGCA